MTTQFTTSVEDRYFEDYVAGSIHEFETITVDEAEVIAFGLRYDPQPFHTDRGMMVSHREPRILAIVSTCFLGSVLVAETLEDQDRREHTTQVFLDIPASKLRTQPHAGPRAKERIDAFAVRSRQPGPEIAVSQSALIRAILLTVRSSTKTCGASGINPALPIHSYSKRWPATCRTYRPPVTQGQWNTITGLRYQNCGQVLGVALGESYGSGLPTKFRGEREDAIAQYREQIIERVDFGSARGS